MRQTKLYCASNQIEYLQTTMTHHAPSPRPHRWLPHFAALAAIGGFTLDAQADSSPPKSNHSSSCDWSYIATLGFSNDNLLPPGLFVPTDRLDPRSSSYADDDGRTFGLVFEQAFTNKRTGLQFVTSTWYEMLTQDGAQENWSRDLRADVLNNIVQANQRFDLGLGWNVFIGMGVGIQTVGDLDGLSVQTWWHENAGFGGRLLGEGLQDDYGNMQGSVTMPALSQGVRLGKLFGAENSWHARVALDFNAFMALGRTGMSFGRVNLGGRTSHPKVADLWAGGFISGANTNDRYLDFAPIAHGVLGYEIGASLNLLHKLRVPVSPFLTIQSNGSGLADTTFMVGFLVGRGALPWLGPPR